jgi:hypothetical protein
MSRPAGLLLLAAAGAAGARKEAFQMVDAKASMASGTAGYVSETMSKLSDGRQLAIVASLGSRHIGKTQLLNSVFGSKFDEGGPAGVWLSPSTHSKDVLLLNPLPADAADSELTQKRMAAMCAALSDCVVVNAWHTTSGRPTTATVDILSGLFSEQLRQASVGGGVPKTLVLYALQGIDGASLPPAELKAAKQQVVALWEGVPKPAGLAGAKLSDYFDFEYVGVPHPRTSAAEYKDTVAKLRASFCADGSGAGAGGGASRLKPAYSKSIDVENFGVLAEQVWLDACAEPDDGLAATRSQMRTCYLASQALFAASEQAERTLAKWSAQISRQKLVPKFGQQGRQLLASTLAAFDAATAGCEPNSKFVLSQRARLAAWLRMELERQFQAQVGAGHGRRVTGGAGRQGADGAWTGHGRGVALLSARAALVSAWVWGGRRVALARKL